MRTPGLDLSVFNDSTKRTDDDIDFQRVWDAGKRFLILRATQAETYVDPQFLSFVHRARAFPFRLGAYSFFEVDANPVDDVEAFLAATSSVKDVLTLAPWMDLEKRSMSARQTVDYVCAWAEKHIAERGCGTVLYSYTSFLLSLIKELGGPASPGALDLVKFPLAIAQYSLREPVLTGLPWSTWAFWQHAASDPNGPLGTCDGVKGAVDLDWFNGSEDDLAWVSRAG